MHGEPTADAGSDQTVATGDTVTMSASATGPTGMTATYGWRQTRVETVTLTGADTRTA